MKYCILLTASILAAAWIGVPTARSGHAAMSDDVGVQITRLVKRVEELERVVTTDPFQPKATVVARLKTVEDRLDAMAKSDADRVRSSTRSREEAGKSLTAMEKQVEQIERRLKDLESAKRDDTASLASDLKSLKQEMERATRTLRDLETRMRRLETK